MIYSHVLNFLSSELSPQTLDSVHNYVKSGLECRPRIPHLPHQKCSHLCLSQMNKRKPGLGGQKMRSVFV